MNIGIDLGTTNSALAYIDRTEAADSSFPPIHIQPIPQFVAPGAEEPRKVLPSFLYLGDQVYAGVYAREQGALEPTRLVHSAKSWLSNPEVDRTAKILPWDSQESGRVFSPVEVSARLLAHLRDAWDQTHTEPLSKQEIVLTVPASFDEEARELTVAAAKDAGIESLTLLEEPAAAFYSWIANHLGQSSRMLQDGQSILIVDVGGGTSDFTLIRVDRKNDQVDFTRTSVGRHLLLGGDNLDLTLAWLVETKLGAQLSLRQRNSIRRQCTAAKERLLSDPNLEKVEITVLGGGGALVGGSRKTEILRGEALELTLEGFLPFCGLGDKPKEESRSLFRELGLPYVSDPAITRHVAAFLNQSPGFGGPDAVLFNGGFFIPEVCRQRLVDVIESWYGRRPAILENRDLDLAVAAGAAYYSYARSTGSGVLVRGGLPRSYYIGIGGAADPSAGLRTVCLVPRGTEEGATLEVDRQDLQLVANRPVTFRLYSSLTRTGEAIGDTVEFGAREAESDLHSHAPLHAVIRFGKRAGERLVPVKLGARLTEIGTLEIWCDSKVSDHRWRLQFQLRKQADVPEQQPARATAVISETALGQALHTLKAAFSGAPTVTYSVAPEELPAKLEQAIGLGKNSWPLPAIRKLADALLEAAEGRKRSAAWEARWLNLCGFCLRPGFGYPGDDFRMEQSRRVYASGLQFANQVQNEIEWWIFWGRLAGGLKRNQQVDLYQHCAGILIPHGKKKQRVNTSLLREMWRAVSSLELLPSHTRTDLGNVLLRRVQSGDFRETELWCLSRLGARELFYGPANQVLAPAVVARWVEALLPLPQAASAIAAMARTTGDPVRDLPATTMDSVRKAFESSPDSEELLAAVEGGGARDSLLLERIFGEELPSGLVFGESDGTAPGLERTGASSPARAAGSN